MTGVKRVNIYTGQQKPTTRNKPNFSKNTQKLIIICKKKKGPSSSWVHGWSSCRARGNPKSEKRVYLGNEFQVWGLKADWVRPAIKKLRCSSVTLISFGPHSCLNWPLSLKDRACVCVLTCAYTSMRPKHLHRFFHTLWKQVSSEHSLGVKQH